MAAEHEHVEEGGTAEQMGREKAHAPAFHAGEDMASNSKTFSTITPRRQLPSASRSGMDVAASTILSAALFKRQVARQAEELEADSTGVTTEERWKLKMQQRKEKNLGGSVWQQESVKASMSSSAQFAPRRAKLPSPEGGEVDEAGLSKVAKWREALQKDDQQMTQQASFFGTHMFSSVFGGTMATRRPSAEGEEDEQKNRAGRLKGRLMAVRALTQASKAEEVVPEEKPKLTLAQLIRKNKFKITAIAAMEIRSEQAGEIFVPGAQIGDEQLDLYGRGHGWRDRLRALIVQIWIINEQLREPKKWISSISFVVLFILFTATAISAFPSENTFLQEQDLIATMSTRGLPYASAQAQNSLQNVSSLDDVYAWLQGPLIDAAFPTSSFIPSSTRTNSTISSTNSSDSANSSEAATASLARLIGRYNVLLSPIRLRQIRVRSDTCSIPEHVWLKPQQTMDNMIMTVEEADNNNLFSRDLSLQAYVYDCSLNLPAPAGNGGCGMIQEAPGDWYKSYPAGQVGSVAGCYSDLNAYTEARAAYGPIETNETKRNFNYSIWEWSSDRDVPEHARYGRLGAYYSGGGYVLDLAPTKAQAVNQTKGMQEGGWLDLSTRAVFVSFLAFNLNVDILTRVDVSIELPKGSGAITWVQATSVYAGDVDVSKDKGLPLQAVTFVAILAYIVWECFDVYRKGYQYWEEPFHVQDMAFNIIYVVGFITRTSIIRTSAFPPSPQDAATYDLRGAAWGMYVWRSCLAFDSVLIYSRFLRTMSTRIPMLHRLYKMLDRTLDVMVASLCVITSSVIAFAVAFQVTFGPSLVEYRSFPVSLFTTFRMIRGGFRHINSWGRIWNENRILGPLFFVLWTFLGSLSIMALFAAMMWSALKDVSLEGYHHETIQQWVARLVKHHLREKERKKELIDMAMRKQERKDQRQAMKVEESVGLAANKMRELEDRRKDTQNQLKRGQSVAPNTPAGPAGTATYWQRLMWELAGFDVDESVEERVHVTHRRLNDIGEKIHEVDRVVSMLSQIMREATDNAMRGSNVQTPFQRLMQSAKDKRTVKNLNDAGAGAGAAMPTVDDAKKKKKRRDVDDSKGKPSGKPYLELKSKTSHAKKPTEEEERKRQREMRLKEKTLLHFRAVDAAGAHAIRVVQARSKKTSLVQEGFEY